MRLAPYPHHFGGSAYCSDNEYNCQSSEVYVLIL